MEQDRTLTVGAASLYKWALQLAIASWSSSLYKGSNFTVGAQHINLETTEIDLRKGALDLVKKMLTNEKCLPAFPIL